MMKEKVGIAFVRVDILANWRFWNEFRKTGNYEDAGKRVISIADALLAEDYESDEIAANLLNESKEFQDKRKKAGQKGGKAKAANARTKKSNDQAESLDAENGNASDNRKAPPSSEPFEDASTGNGEENENSGTSSNNSVRGSAKPSCETREQSRRTLPPPNAEAVYDFAIKEKLDTADAREWYEINFVDRPGCDKDGVVITNWKGHCKNFCKAAAKRRAG